MIPNFIDYKISIIKFLLYLMALLIMPIGYAQEILITFNPSVKINKKNILLGDLLKSCVSKSLECEKIENIKLPYILKIGRSKRITISYLKKLVESQPYLIEIKKDFSNPTIIAHRPAQKLGVRSVKKLVVSQLQREIYPTNDQIRFKIKSLVLLERIMLDEGSYEYSFPLFNENSLDQIDGSIKMDLYISQFHNKMIYKFPVIVNFEKLEPVVTLAEDISKGSILSKNHLKMEFKRRANKNYLINLKEGIGYITKKGLKKGAALKRKYIRNKIFIKRHTEIEVELNSKTISINTKGKALQSGEQGDEILVSLKNPKKKLKGIVKSSTKVSVKL